MSSAPHLRSQLFINNEWRDASDGSTFTVFNPSTGRPLMECSNATAADVDAAVAAARAWCVLVWVFAAEAHGAVEDTECSFVLFVGRGVV